MTVLEFLESLEHPCPVCRGHGRVVGTDWRPHVTQGTLPAEGDPLRDKPMEIPCPTCDGRGHQLTDLGAILLAFVQRYLH